MKNEQTINVKITADDKRFDSAMKADEKAIEKVGKAAKAAKAEISDLGKVKSNVAGIFSGKAKDTGLGSFIDDVTAGTGALDKFFGPATVAAGAIVGIGSAAIATGKTLFDMAKSASDYSGDISDASQKTGLAIDTISSIKFAGDAFGASFEDMTMATANFTKLIGDAAKGSDEANKTLKALGVDPKTAVNDLDGALGQAIKTIHNLPPGVQQLNASSDAFGKKLGGKVIPVVNAFNGDLNALKKRASELGIVLTDEAIKAGDDFGDTYEIVAAQAKATGAAFALEFAPAITDAMQDVSKYLADNKDDWKEWGRDVGDIIRGVKLAAQEFGEFKAVQQAQEETYGRLLFAPLYAIGDIARPFADAGRASREAEEARWKNVVRENDGTAVPLTSKPKGTPKGSYFDGLGSGKKEKTEAQKTNWTSATLAEFARNNGFAVNLANGSGAAKSGHNDGSLHYVKKAFDTGLGATNPNKTVEQIVSYMENALKAGIRVVDERVRPKKGAKWSGPHIHTEENDSKASFFNPNLDYGGRIEYLKALDAERLKGKGQSISDALGKINKTEIGEGAKAIADLEKELKLLGVTTRQGRIEVELSYGAYKDLDNAGKARLLLAAGQVDTTEAQSKAEADLTAHITKLGEEYDELNGVQKTATSELEKFLAAYARTGNVIDPVREEIARSVAAATDLQNAEEKLTKASEDNIATYKAERDAVWDLTLAHQELKNAIARETGGREVSAGGISDSIDWKPYIDAMNAAGKAPAPALFTKNKTGEFMDGLLGGNGNNLARFESEADAMKAVYNDLSNTAGAAMGAMIDGGAQLLEQWIMTGEISGQAIAQMTGSIIAGVASQAGVKAIFEVAEGLAAAASFPLNPDGLRQAAMHYAAAKTYGIVALGATAVGAGIGAAGGLGGKKDKSSSNSSQNPSEYFQNDKDSRSMNYLRQSQNSSSGFQQVSSRLEERINGLSGSIDKLEGRIGSVTPGDMLTNGIRQKRGLITETVTKELGKNSTAVSVLGRRLNMK